MLFMLVVMSVPALMNNVLEEKMQKIAEVLISSVTPFELMMGKLLSAVCVSMTLGVLYVGTALAFVHNVDDIPPQVLTALNPGILAWFTFFLLLALLIFGSMFSALGSACSELQDAQTLMMPAMILMMLPMFFLGPVIDNPGGPLATILSLIPPFTPLLLFLRMAIPPGVQWWELTLALVLTGAFTSVCVMGSAKIFRIGILSQGQTPTYRNLIGWLMSR
jgi:ABC-2 type transport system permease protein